MFAFSWPMLLVLASAILFLATAGLIIVNSASVAALFGHERRRAEPGELIVDHRGERRRMSPGGAAGLIALHIAGLAGIVIGTLLMMDYLN